MNSPKRNTQNLNLKEENSSLFIFGNYSGLLLKSSFNSVLPRLLFFFFFCRYQTSTFFITLSLRALLLAFVEKVHLPLLGDGGGVFIVGQLMFIISVGLLWQAGLYMTCIVRRAPLLKPVRKPVLNCLNLATWFSYLAIWWNQFEGSWMFDAHQRNSSAIRQSSRAIILKSRFFSTGHSACTSEVRDIFWSSDLCTQWLMTADVLECSLTLRTPQFNDGARP